MIRCDGSIMHKIIKHFKKWMLFCIFFYVGEKKPPDGGLGGVIC